jgi:hypothetical protein
MREDRLMSNRCFVCKKPQALTLEHIIPQAVGGRLKARLYCKVCNDTFGHELDDEISKQFGWVGTLLNIKRDRGEPQPYEVEELKSGIPLVFDGKGLKRRDPIIKRTSRDGKKLDSADITARSERELKEVCASIQKRYEVSGGIETFKDVHPGPTEAKHETTIDNPLLRRAVSKIAYGFLCIKLPKDVILSSPFEAVRDYVKAGKEPHLACANFIYTQFMIDHIRPLHKIHVALNRNEETVIGYVSLFGIYRFTILLAENFGSKFEWPGLDYTYDPVRLEEVVGNDNFRAQRLTKEQILHPKQPKEFIQGELHKGYKVIESYVDKFKFSGGELI